jgi:hypothetical protein
VFQQTLTTALERKKRRNRIMANISILGLTPAGSALFAGSENFVDAIRDVSETELGVSGGGGYCGGGSKGGSKKGSKGGSKGSGGYGCGGGYYCH